MVADADDTASNISEPRRLQTFVFTLVTVEKTFSTTALLVGVAKQDNAYIANSWKDLLPEEFLCSSILDQNLIVSVGICPSNTDSSAQEIFMQYLAVLFLNNIFIGISKVRHREMFVGNTRCLT